MGFSVVPVVPVSFAARYSNLQIPMLRQSSGKMANGDPHPHTQNTSCPKIGSKNGPFFGGYPKFIGVQCGKSSIHWQFTAMKEVFWAIIMYPIFHLPKLGWYGLHGYSLAFFFTGGHLLRGHGRNESYIVYESWFTVNQKSTPLAGMVDGNWWQLGQQSWAEDPQWYDTVQKIYPDQWHLGCLI